PCTRSTRPLACGELAAMMRIPSLAHICPNWVTAASPRNRSCTLGRRTYTFFQSVYKARGTPYDPGTQQMGRRPGGFPRAELAQHRAGGDIYHVHETAVVGARAQPRRTDGMVVSDHCSRCVDI